MAQLLVLAMGLAVGLPKAHATDGGMSDFSYRAWTVRDGAPPDVWTLAGGHDGVLWLGTGLGLYRFDGLRFERVRPGGVTLAALNINALLVDDDGSIWTGQFEGGVTHLQGDHVTTYGSADGLPGGRVLRLVRASGALWAAAGKGLARFDGQRWTRVGAAMGYPEPSADYLFRDRQGTLWVSSGDRLYRLAAGATHFDDTGIAVSRNAVLAQDGQDRLWLADGLGSVRPLGLPASWQDWAAMAAMTVMAPTAQPASLATRASARLALPAVTATLRPPSADAPRPTRAGAGLQPAPLPSALPTNPVKQLLFASDGGLWVTVMGRGVFRTAEADRQAIGQPLDGSRGEWFTVQDGLASQVTVPLLESADGEVWVGSNLGVNSLRPRRIRTVSGLEDATLRGYSVQPQARGMLLSSATDAWRLDPPGSPEREAVALPPNAGTPGAWQTLRGADGAVWQIGADAIWRLAPGRRWQRWPLPLPPDVTSTEVNALAADPTGGIWLGLRDAGVFHASRDGIARRADAEDGDHAVPGAIAVAADGSAWFGYDGVLVGLDAQGRRQRFDAAQGLRTGRITAVLPSRHGLVVAGENGVALGRGTGFATLSIERDPAFGRVSGVVESADGDLWLNGGRGLVRLAAAELASLFIESAHPLGYQLLDAGDGLPGVAQQASPLSTAARDARGRLWFVTNQGVAWLDPALTRRSGREVGVDMQAVMVSGQRYAPAAGLTLPQGTRALTLRYAARVLSKAEQVRYRFRLVGVDADWREAGTQREATYANLGPGDYRFEVLASNPDGLWGSTPAALAFRIAPEPYQQPAFRWAVALALLAAIWGGYRLRVRALQARLRMRLEERHRERERIARDLHDTLLQGFQGLLLGLDASVRRIADATLRRRMERDLTRAEALLAEGRDRVGQLRDGSMDNRPVDHRDFGGGGRGGGGGGGGGRGRGRDGHPGDESAHSGDRGHGGDGGDGGDGARSDHSDHSGSAHGGERGADGSPDRENAGPGAGPDSSRHLAERLAQAGLDLIRPPARFVFRVSGAPRALPAPVEDQMLLIAREGLTNAQRHARADRVELELDYRQAAVTMAVRDDGVGLVPGWERHDGMGARFGMRGMQERARLMHASLGIRSSAGEGTELLLRVGDGTASGAIATGPWRRLKRWLRWRRGDLEEAV